MRVLIAGKQATLRYALKTLLQTRPGLQITGTAVNQEQLFVQLKNDCPDLLLLDEELSSKLVDEVIVPIGRLDPRPIVVVLGDGMESRKVCLYAGVEACISKGGPPKDLLTAIEVVRLRRKNV